MTLQRRRPSPFPRPRPVMEVVTPPYGLDPATAPLPVVPQQQVDPLSGPLHLIAPQPGLFEPTTTLEPFPPPGFFDLSAPAWDGTNGHRAGRRVPEYATEVNLFEPAPPEPAAREDDDPDEFPTSDATVPRGIRVQAGGAGSTAVGGESDLPRPDAPPAAPGPAASEPAASEPAASGPAASGPAAGASPDESPITDAASTSATDPEAPSLVEEAADEPDRPPSSVDWVTAALPVVRPAEPRAPAASPEIDGDRPGTPSTPVPWLLIPEQRPASPEPDPPSPAEANTPEEPAAPPAPRGDRWSRRVGRSVLHLVGGAATARELTDLAAAAQIPLAGNRRIAVVGPRGGAGRSTVAALLACVYAARRADRVLVADAEPALGSLAWRLGAEHDGDPVTLGSTLLAARDGTLDEVAALLPTGPAGLRVLPGGTGATKEITRALAGLFAITVIDGGGPPDPDVHVAVLVTPATADGIRTSAAVLRRWNGGAVVALVDRDRGVRPPLADLEEFDVPVVHLPHDRHLAAGAAIRPDRLAAATRREATRLAGLALEAAVRGPTPR